MHKTKAIPAEQSGQTDERSDWKMTKTARKALRAEIINQLDDDMMPLTVGGHTITDQYVYAGCSQWSVGCGRDWDETQHAYAYIVDGKYMLTFPDLDYFDGHNKIERQSRYYLQPDRSEEPPCEPEGEPLDRVPCRVLIQIGQGLADAIAVYESEQEQQDQQAHALTSTLSPNE